MALGDTRNSTSVRIISFNIFIMNEQEEKVAEEMLEDTSPEGILRNAELARQVAEEVYQSDDDSDDKVDNGNYPQDMDKTLI